MPRRRAIERRDDHIVENSDTSEWTHDLEGPADAHAADLVRPPPGQDLIPDRKSTRLNSSHANISYAVFCLKKKTHFSALIFDTTETIAPIRCCTALTWR